MLWLERKYANLMSGNLGLYKITADNPYIAAFRCPYCGDSKKKATKRRGYLFQKGDKINFYCHNCGSSQSFSAFLEEQNPPLFLQYKLENLKNLHKSEEPDENLFRSRVEFRKPKIRFEPSLDQCTDDDNVRQYAESRMIPHKYFQSLHTCTNINNLTTQLTKYQELKLPNVSALVIPFYNSDREYSYICCRIISARSSSFRYFNFDVDELHPKIWGLESIDWSKPVIVVEGVIDALMLPNALALGGSTGTRAIEALSDDRKKISFCYDNEISSNSQIRQQVKNRIIEGYGVVLYDKRFHSKDLNEAVVKGEFSADGLAEYIEERTFHGLTAKLELTRLLRRKH